MNLLALACYALYPLMPPRLLDDCTTAFGGCEPGFRFVDTMHVYGGLWSWRQSAVGKVGSPALQNISCLGLSRTIWWWTASSPFSRSS